MKKLMIAFAAIAMAICAQAATANWASGALFRAAGASGGWDTTKGAVANSMQVTMTAYYIDATTYDTVKNYSQSELMDYISNQSLTAKGSAQNKNATSGNIIATATFADTTDIQASTTYYAILTAEYTDATYGDMYMAAASKVTVGPTGTGTASNIFGGTTSGGVRNWQAVPEPTSGLLLLLGMAGLALRRRRA